MYMIKVTRPKVYPFESPNWFQVSGLSYQITPTKKYGTIFKSKKIVLETIADYNRNFATGNEEFEIIKIDKKMAQKLAWTKFVDCLEK